MRRTQKRERVYFELTNNQKSTLLHIWDLLSVGISFVICLAAIYLGLMIVIRTNNTGITLLASLGCWGVIHSLLGQKRM